MPNVTVICFLASVFFYGMGFDHNSDVSLATAYFVLAIIFSMIGCLNYVIKYQATQVITKTLVFEKPLVRKRMMETMKAS